MMEGENLNFAPLTPEERDQLVEDGFTSILGGRLQAHLLAQAALGEIDGVSREEILRGILESQDAGVPMADAVFMDLPEERREVLRRAAWAHVRNALEHAVRQHEHACKQLEIDPRGFPADTFALFAATPAMLSRVLFDLPGDPE